MASLNWRVQLEPGAEVRLLTPPSLRFSPYHGGAIRPGGPPSGLGGSALLSYPMAAEQTQGVSVPEGSVQARLRAVERRMGGSGF